MHVHSLKHNAKAAAKRLCARYSGIEVVEPVAHIPLPGPLEEGWYASVKVIDGVLPLSIAPEVFEAAHVALPAGWVLSGLTALKAAQASNRDDAIAARFADLNPDRLAESGANPAAVQVIGGEDVTLEEAQDAAAFMQAVAANGGTNDGMGTLVPTEQVAALDAALAAVKPEGKEAQVFAMLRRPAGASASEIGAALNWQLHTTRAYVSVHSRKYGLEVVTEKVEGRGTVYRVRVPAKSETAA